MSKLQNIMSYLFPIIIAKREGKVTDYLEVTKSNGKYVLNSANANYSFGGLHEIFDTFLNKINISQFKTTNILLLGMGAGDIVTLLKEKHKINTTITAIEKDPIVIELAKTYFNIDRFNNLKIVEADAFEFCKNSNEKFDLVIIDIFVDGDVPSIFATNEFITNLRNMMSEKSCLIYNKMTEKPHHKVEFNKLLEELKPLFPGAEMHKLNSFGWENSLIYYNTIA